MAGCASLFILGRYLFRQHGAIIYGAVFGEFLRARSIDGAQFFVNAISAFYNVVGRLVTGIVHTPDAWAYILESLSVPPGALHELCSKFQQPDALTAAKVPAQFRALFGEFFNATWFAVANAHGAMILHKGSRILDPFGDITFNLLMMLIIR